MLEARKNSLQFASDVSGTDKAHFSRFMKNNSDFSIYTLESLSKRQSKLYADVLMNLTSLPWKIAILTDLTGQKRSDPKSDNVKKFNHGKGYFI